MNLVYTYTGRIAREEAATKPPDGAGFNARVVARTESLEVYRPKCTDCDPGYCELHAIDADGNILAKKKVRGY